MLSSLFNLRGASSRTDPLLVYLPPFPSQDNISQLPSFLNGLPVASINYRWSPYSTPSANTSASTPLHWPTPVHDTAFAMTWLLKHMCPPGYSRRDIYVYGSYLGASLATSLALTEAYPDENIGVRGLLAYNGVYDWTMFLPEHPINRPSTETKAASLPSGPNKDSHLHLLHKNMPRLFRKPTNLFDPFASPSLFFHCLGLNVPQSFYEAEHATWIDDMCSDGDMTEVPIKVPRKSHVVFPPKKSDLRIPEALIVYETTPPPAVVKVARHSFQIQAADLVNFMRRSIDVVELRERVNRFEGADDHWSEIATRRVQIMDAGPETGNIEPGDTGCDIISSWLEKRF
ncbi:hypothetical protein E4U21_003722 [Claviceps maximensis]|nr:hypothetical protein E4U21_003722 [Claviceps maximensis]